MTKIGHLSRVATRVFNMWLLHAVSFSILKSPCEIAKVFPHDFCFQLCENAPQSSTDKKAFWVFNRNFSAMFCNFNSENATQFSKLIRKTIVATQLYGRPFKILSKTVYNCDTEQRPNLTSSLGYQTLTLFLYLFLCTPKPQWTWNCLVTFQSLQKKSRLAEKGIQKLKIITQKWHEIITLSTNNFFLQKKSLFL